MNEWLVMLERNIMPLPSRVVQLKVLLELLVDLQRY
jgi:hypothetical protein